MSARTDLYDALKIELSQSGDSETLVKVAGIETDMPCAEISVNIEDSDFSGEDRQMLTQIVQRWGTLSDELKRAVLRVVG